MCQGAPPPSAAPMVTSVTTVTPPSLLTADNCTCVAISLCRPGDQAVNYGQGQIDLRKDNN